MKNYCDIGHFYWENYNCDSFELFEINVIL